MQPSDVTNPTYRSLVENTFRADGTRDAALFVSRLTEDATFQLGGLPPVEGRPAIQDLVTKTFAAFEDVHHTLVKAYELSDVLIYEATVLYQYKDGRKALIPYVNVLDFAGEMVRRYRIYLDLSTQS